MTKYHIPTPNPADAKTLGDQLSAANNAYDVVVNADNTVDVILNSDTESALDLLSAIVTAQPWYIGGALSNPLADSLKTTAKLLAGRSAVIDAAVDGTYTQAQAAQQPRRDPLTFDLDNDGLETVGINATAPILFDHDGDGIKTATGWVKADDGFLVLDRNGNGSIDTGLELFGDSTPLASGGNAADGFAALAQEDTNADGEVDALDARFNQLRIWQDLNQDGISQSNELKTLTELNIASIHVSKTEHSKTLANGNQIADLGTYTRTDGSSGEIEAVSGNLGDINLAESTFHSHFTDTITETTAATALPDMQGSGKVRDLRQAASLGNASGNTLASLLQQFSTATTSAQQRSLLPGLLDAWADTSGMVETLDDRDPKYLIRYDSFGGVRRSAHIVPPTIGAAPGSNTGGSGNGALLFIVRDVDNHGLDQTYRDTVAHWDQVIHTLEAFNGRYFFKLPEEEPSGGAANEGMWRRAA